MKTTNTLSLRLKYLLALCIFAFVSACSTTLSVQSEPAGAEVFISQSPNSKSAKSLGKTPIELDFNDLPLDRGGYLIFELPGYLTETVLISEPAVGTTSGEMFLRLSAGTRDGEKASTLLNLLASAQEQARVGKIDMAHSTIDRALEVDGYFVRGLSFKAALYFLEKKYNESEIFYKKALNIDPNFPEATRMLTKIELERKAGG
jgi:tetratricopeptide (TPR) repeat protein